jgi:hypothetical protein
VAHLPDRENPSDLLAIVLELPGPDIMRRPPFRPKESIFARGLGFYIVRIGIIFAISQYRPNARGGKPLRRGWRVENDGFYYPLSRADGSRDLLSIERSSSNRDESPRKSLSMGVGGHHDDPTVNAGVRSPPAKFFRYKSFDDRGVGDLFGV